MSMPYMVFYVQDPSGTSGSGSDESVLEMMAHLHDGILPSIRAKL